MPRPSKRIPTVSNEFSPEAQQVIDHLRTLLSQLESTKKKREVYGRPFVKPKEIWH